MEPSIVIKSKVEISRNLKNFSFPHKLSADESNIILEKIKSILFASEYDLTLKKLEDLSAIEINTLTERQLITEEFIVSEHSAILINEDQTICILINALDHIKIEIISYTNNVAEIYNIANEIDDLIEEHVEYAFDKELGYLTVCPVYIGTGLKVTSQIHIPAISRLKKVENYYKVAHKLGINFKGIYGRASSILGNLYEISNMFTLGRTEENIIQSIESLLNNIIETEKEARKSLDEKDRLKIEDDVFRSVAILSSARMISNTELMKCLSNIKLGIEMNYLKDTSLENVDRLMTGRDPYIKVITSYDREDESKRASYIRQEFNLSNRNK